MSNAPRGNLMNRHDAAAPDICESCTKLAACRAQGMACPDYAYWLNYGLVKTGGRQPSADLFDQLFPGEGDERAAA